MARECGIARFSGYGMDCEYQLCRTPNGSNVHVELTAPGCSQLTYWKMELQRYWAAAGQDGWTTIGTRTGFVHRTSPSNRTFTNIRKENKWLRVVVYVWADEAGQMPLRKSTDGSNRMQTSYWTW